MTCSTCKSDKAIKITTKYSKELKKSVSFCNECSNGKASKMYSYRDAGGNEISLPSYMYGRYSPAIDMVITSKQQYSEVLRSNGLIQKGTEYQK